MSILPGLGYPDKVFGVFSPIDRKGIYQAGRGEVSGPLLTEDFCPSHMMIPRRSYLLAVLEPLCETYPGKVLSRELFLPSGDFMEVDTHICWYNDVSLLEEQMEPSIVTWRCRVHLSLSLVNT